MFYRRKSPRFSIYASLSPSYSGSPLSVSPIPYPFISSSLQTALSSLFCSTRKFEPVPPSHFFHVMRACVRMAACMCACMCEQGCVDVCLCACMCVCMCGFNVCVRMADECVRMADVCVCMFVCVRMVAVCVFVCVHLAAPEVCLPKRLWLRQRSGCPSVWGCVPWQSE